MNTGLLFISSGNVVDIISMAKRSVASDGSPVAKPSAKALLYCSTNLPNALASSFSIATVTLL